MKLWGDNLEALRIASGTIYNEVPNLPCDCYSTFPFYHSQTPPLKAKILFLYHKNGIGIKL